MAHQVPQSSSAKKLSKKNVAAHAKSADLAVALSYSESFSDDKFSANASPSHGNTRAAGASWCACLFGRKRSGPGESTRLVVVEKTKTIVLGHAVSDDLKKFVGVFQPYAADTDEGKALRKKGFHFADPSGNGLCSVAEIENFILVTLLAAFPKQAKADLDVGRDLFTAFRPCYIRAYNDAKDYKADDGTVLGGTKKSTADDLVSKVEFRVFNAQLVVYAMMFDAFALVDGGGAGRKAIEDRRIEKAEWMARYNDVVMPYGFAAFKGLVNDKQADAAFKKMDADGAGMVLLIEWCAFIKAAEVEAGTPVGQVLLLGADENGELGGKRAHGRSKKRAAALKAKEAAQRAKAAANQEKSDKASARKRERRAQEGITIQEMELCAREIIAEELAGQKEVWAARQANGELDTVPDVGHYQKATRSSARERLSNEERYDAEQYMKVHMRAIVSELLAGDQVEWQKRQAEGRLATKPKARAYQKSTKSSASHAVVGGTSAQERIEYGETHARAIVAAELSRARQTYEQRGWDNGGAYSTVPEVGHYQTATKSSALLKKLPTTAEQLNQANRRSREDIGLEGAKQQSLWNARATKETVADDMGRLGEESKAAARRKKAIELRAASGAVPTSVEGDHLAQSQLEELGRRKARDGMHETLAASQAAYTKRHESLQENHTVPLEFNLTASPRHANPNGIPVMKTQAEREASAATGARHAASADLAQASEAYRKRVAVQGESTQPDQDLAEAAFMRPTVASQAAGAASPKFKTARELEKEALRNERAEREELNSEARLQWEKRRVKMAAQN